MSSRAAVSKYLGFDAILKRVVTNGGWVLTSNLIGLILSLAQSILVARILGVGSYGMLSLVIVFVSIINHLTSFKMNEFVVKFVSDAFAQNNLNFAAAIIKLALLLEVGASFFAFAVTILLAPIGAQWIIHDSTASSLIMLYAFITVANLTPEAATGVLQVYNQFRMQSIFTVVGKIISLAVAVAAYVFHLGLFGVLMAYFAGNLSASWILFAFSMRETRTRLGPDWWRVHLSSLKGYWRQIWKFAVSTNVSGTLSMIGKESDVLILGFFRSREEVGYYKLALQLASLVMTPITPLSSTVYPELTREAAARNWLSFKSLLKKTSLIASAYIMPVLIATFVCGKWLVSFTYGKDYAPAFNALLILLVGLAVSNIFFWARPALLALGYADYAVFINSIVISIKLAGVIIVIPVFGYLGNAALMSFVNIVGISIAVFKIITWIRFETKLDVAIPPSALN